MAWRRQVPLLMAEQGTHTTVCTALGLPGADSLDLREWKTQIADRWDAICADPVSFPFILDSVKCPLASCHPRSSSTLRLLRLIASTIRRFSCIPAGTASRQSNGRVAPLAYVLSSLRVWRRIVACTQGSCVR